MTTWIGFIASLLAVSPAFAQSNNNACVGKEPAVIREVPFKGQPSFFFRAFPAEDMVSFASSESRNRIFDLRTGEEVEIPGSYDPVPLWNERYMVVPISDGGATRMEFFAMNDLRKSKRNTKPVRRNELEGTYQSVGSLPSIDGVEVYRIITAYLGVSSRDYKVRDGKSGEAAIEPIGDPVLLCKGYDLKLPMLSKNGTELAALDARTNTTKIFGVDPATNMCVEKLDLGVQTGKVDFSFDGRFLAYHVSKVDVGGSFFSRPDKSWSMQVHVYDRVKRRVHVLSADMARNSYFPVFRQDGTIVFLRSDKSGENYVFAVADLKKAGIIDAEGGAYESEKKVRAPVRAKEMLDAVACRSMDASPEEIRRSLLSYRSVIERKCQYCHADPSIGIDFFNVSALKAAKPKRTPAAANMLQAIGMRLRGTDGVVRMPLEGQISEEEVQVVLQELGIVK
ncbi:MAG: hypothetical protein NDI61_00995 [Bdellovibrionaceae bacterium]|nr:hypothetical protein [Pseudobdellovibrionaceae bacterium]